VKGWCVGVCWCVLVCVGVCWCVLVCVGVCWCVLVCVNLYKCKGIDVRTYSGCVMKLYCGILMCVVIYTHVVIYTQHSTPQHTTAHHSTTQHSTPQHSTAQHQYETVIKHRESEETRFIKKVQ
jgi:amino acid permease